MIKLTKDQEILKTKFYELKEQAGTHSPSIETLKTAIPEIEISIDACFLSNPYATDLFVDHLNRDVMIKGKFRAFLEFYPSQNNVIASRISSAINVRPQSIFVGNGAIEIIQAVIKNFVKKKMVIVLPTFSPFYEFAESNIELVFFYLDKENSFKINLRDLSKFIKNEKPDSLVLVNPNNPTGGYILKEDLISFIDLHKELENIIVDESFIHFAIEYSKISDFSIQNLVKNHDNLIVIKSMSKDFGIAGIRAGYAVMSPTKVELLTRYGFLWNSNGISEYFFSLYSKNYFRKEYEQIRRKYINETQSFFNSLITIPNIRVYPSVANFVLVELIDGTRSEDFVFKLLLDYGIYIRIVNDKKGLNGEFVRIASRSSKDNHEIVQSIKSIFKLS